jgi:hypothetical protein
MLPEQLLSAERLLVTDTWLHYLCITNQASYRDCPRFPIVTPPPNTYTDFRCKAACSQNSEVFCLPQIVILFHVQIV